MVRLRFLAALSMLVGMLVALPVASPDVAQAAADPCATRPSLTANTFVTCWDTRNTGTGSTGDSTIALPLVNGGTYNFTVNWGDGITSTVTAWNDADATHTYTTAGRYWVTITGTIEGFAFQNSGDRLKLINVGQWGQLKFGNTGGYFHGAENFNVSADDSPSLIGTTTLRSAFERASAFNAPIGSWDISNITSLESTFAWAAIFNQDLSGWNTSNVTDMRGTFFQAYAFNGNITTWNVSNVTSFENAFHAALVFDQDIGSWVTSSATDMTNMFLSAIAFNQDIGDWNTSNVTSMHWTFFAARKFNNGGQPLTWNVSRVSSFSNMFEGAHDFNQSLSSWNIRTSGPVTMHSMFHDARVFNQDLSSWDMSQVTDTSSMFKNSFAYDNAGQSLTWDDSLSNVLNMSQMFNDARQFNWDISGWDVSAVTNMQSMFSGATSFAQDIGSWNIGAVTNMTSMFAGVTLPSAVYDGILNGWAAQSVQPNVVFNGGSSRYTLSGEAARASLIADDTWTITDAGLLTVVPDPPTAVTAVAGDAQAMVSWQAPAFPGTSAITGYTATSTPDGLTCTTTGALTCTITGLVNGTSYTFTVTAENGVGPSVASTSSAPVTPQDPVPPEPISPGAPLDVTAQASGQGVRVTWMPPAASGSFVVTNYQVQSSVSDRQCLTSAAVTNCEIFGLRAGTTYTFRVRALTGAGWGPWSTWSNSVTPDGSASIVISGSREGRDVRVVGATIGMDTTTVTPWVRFPGPHAYEPESGVRTVRRDGTFTWQRQTAKKIYVYFSAGDGVRSNRVVIPAREASLAERR